LIIHGQSPDLPNANHFGQPLKATRPISFGTRLRFVFKDEGTGWIDTESDQIPANVPFLIGTAVGSLHI